MEIITATDFVLEDFSDSLKLEEKSPATISKYLRDAKVFLDHCAGGEISKETVISYKQHLIDSGYAIRSINSMIASVNCLLVFLGHGELRVKALKVQHDIFCLEEQELTREEYQRLCQTAEKKNNLRLSLLIQTICSTGIRVSELKYITLEAVRSREAAVSCKGKTRRILIVRDLQKKLLQYASRNRISSGAIFVSKRGCPLDRTYIWREMKQLCLEAGVDARKVFPHNLRHLFARVFYKAEKDISKLADILGHSNINTTRIYIISTVGECQRQIEKMKLVI